MKLPKATRGFVMIEMLVASAILVLVMVAFVSSLTLFSRASESATERAQALFLAQGGVEIMRGLRDASWSTNIELEPFDTPLGLSFDGTNWSIVSAPQTIDGFERSVELGAVHRDSNDDITSSGTFDEDARFVTVKVSWNGGVDTVELQTILTNIFDN